MNPAGAEAWAFPPEPSSSREARRRVSSALEARNLEAVSVTVAQVVSELATNAVLHARTPFEVRVHVLDGSVRIEVHDGSGRRPDRRYFSDQARVAAEPLTTMCKRCAVDGTSTPPGAAFRPEISRPRRASAP